MACEPRHATRALDDGFLIELPVGACALFTTRAHGNLSLAAGVGHEQGLARRHGLCESLRLSWLCAGPQVHGTDVRRVDSLAGRRGEPVSEPADGHATVLPGVGAMVLTADCLPVVLASHGAVAAVHAGWRGLAAGVLQEGVRALREMGGEGEIVAAVGPCAGPCCYEVGEEVRSAFGGVESAAAGRTTRTLDLRAIAHETLGRAGVAQVLDARACTICDERLFSHRREGAAAGRQAGIAWRC